MNELIEVSLDKLDMINLIKGTGGPGAYIHPFEYLGKLDGFPNEKWYWNEDNLNKFTLNRLWDIYNELKHFKVNDKQYNQ